jgi:alcohol dehydrogenase (NADP+)
MFYRPASSPITCNTATSRTPSRPTKLPPPQVEAHPYFRNDALLAFCSKAGVHVTAYSPLGSPDSASLLQRQAPVLLQDLAVQQVAEEVGRSPAQVLIR